MHNPFPQMAFAVFLLLGVTGCGSLAVAEQRNLESMGEMKIEKIAGDCQATHAGNAGRGWHLAAQADGKGASVRFSPADGKSWDLSAYECLVLSVRNAGASPVIVRARIANPDANELAGICQTAATIMPGQSQKLDLRIMPTPADPGYESFKPFFKYFTKINVRDNTVMPANIDGLTIWLDGPSVGDSIEISQLQLAGQGKGPAASFFPFIDKYGQYAHADWPGKIHSDGDFALRRVEEEAERAAWPGPSDWNKYGGWTGGPQLKATGFFWTAKHEGKWWLVDPEGRLFWSYGPTGAGFGPDLTPITDRESWFADLPPNDGPTTKYYSKGTRVLYQYYRDREWTGFQFSAANIERKYGPDAAEEMKRITTDRMKSWGFNTLGNWSPPAMMAHGRTPYVTPIHFSAPGVNSHMPDVFAPEWEENLKQRMERERQTTAKDPWNIGYFVDNERKWGKWPRFAGVGLQILEAPPTVQSKLLFIEDLTAKYGSIEKLNASWGTTHASWEAMLESRVKVSFDEPKNPNLQADCGDFGMKFGEKYFSACRRQVKAVAPNHMYLGARLHSHIDVSLIEVQTKYCDVISYNMYDPSPDGRMKQYAQIDFPFMITEWGIDNDPRQSPFRASKAEVSIGTQIPRREALERFAERAILHPQIVGAHFFQYRDQPLSGRPDGEALLRGFVNGTDTPNFELVQANRKVSYDLYKKRAQAK